MKKIRVGIIGYGLSGKYLQIPFFLHHPKFELVSVVTSQLVDLPVSVNKLTDIQDVITDSSIDLISICSPNETHVPYVRLALEANKHVLVEKPMAVTEAEMKALFALSKEKNKVLAVFQNRRWDSDFLTVKKVIQSGILGKIVRLEIRFDRFKQALNVKKWKEVSIPTNGILYDLGAHIIDQAVDLFGTPAAITGKTYMERPNSAISDAFDVLLDYTGGPSVFLHASLLALEPLPRYVVYGTEGSFIKYGIDIQEDQLKEGVSPLAVHFGEESPEFQGLVSVWQEGKKVSYRLPTEKGNWMALFDSLAEAIQGVSSYKITDNELFVQGKIYDILQKRSS